MSERNCDKIEREAKEYFSAYSEGAKMLRAWFIAYGVGGPVLFLTQEGISSRILESGQANFIVYLFLAGVLFQVVIALINKWVNWILYAYANPSDKKSRTQKTSYEVADVISEQFWLDMLADLGSIFTFGWATLKVLLICVGTQA